MIGLGVGIDYALFIVTRYRAALKRGLAPEHAVREAMGTAGRAVVFAGVTVMISLLGLLLMGLDFVRGLAFGTASSVLIAVLAAVTLLPALLGFAGRRIDRLAIHRRDHHTGRLAYRWSRVVQRRPVVAAAAGAGALLILAAPVFAMRLATADGATIQPARPPDRPMTSSPGLRPWRQRTTAHRGRLPRRRPGLGAVDRRRRRRHTGIELVTPARRRRRVT